jgi:hypothetical protein
MTPPGGVKLDFNPNEVTAVLRRRTACGRLRPHVGAPNRVTLCGGLGVFMEQSAASAGGTGKIDDLGVTSRIKNRSVHRDRSARIVPFCGFAADRQLVAETAHIGSARVLSAFRRHLA